MYSIIVIVFILIKINIFNNAHILNNFNYIKRIALINESAPIIGTRFEDYQFFKELKGTCQTTNDCRLWAYVCRSQLCVCAKGYIPDATNETCIGAIGKQCMYDDHCITNAYCRGQTVCTCKAEYPILSDDKLSCEDEFSGASRKSFMGSNLIIIILVRMHGFL